MTDKEARENNVGGEVSAMYGEEVPKCRNQE